MAAQGGLKDRRQTPARQTVPGAFLPVLSQNLSLFANPDAVWGRPAWHRALTVFPVLEGRRKLFGSDPGDARFLLGFLRRRHGRLRLGPGVGGPARQRRDRDV